MSSRLAQKYARYGLLANLNLSALEHLRTDGGGVLRPSGDDKKRLRLLRDLLTASWRGAFINGQTDRAEPPETGDRRLNLAARGGTRSAKSSLDDAEIVEGALPDKYRHDLPRFVEDTVPVIESVIQRGVRKTDSEFVEGPLTEFLERLARSNRTRPTESKRRRQHVPLA